jgi:hypothetical protein
MSEYQYYEFAAVDRPLTPQQQAELRARSSRATITATSFINEYHWGDLKGDPLDWVRRWFDAHVYSANWGSCRLLLRLPRAALDEAALIDFAVLAGRKSRSAGVAAFEATPTPEHWILDWSFNDDSGEFERFWSEEDGPGWMTRLLPLRDELLRGDTRPLYLGWLARLGNDEMTEDDNEPPLPAGLGTLSPAQAALAEFLLIDPDWLDAAAEASPPLPEARQADSRIDAWLDTLAPEEIREVLRLLLAGRGQEAERGVRNRFLAWERSQSPQAKTGARRRTVAEIDARRVVVREARLQRERMAHEAAEAGRRQERAAFLAALLAKADTVWATIDQILQRGTGAAYDQALRGVQDLAEAFSQAGKDVEFRRGLTQLMAQHGKRRAWVSRLSKAGLQWEPKA